MANVRIKDLSTTASTTASDDFFGVDGATNGTRKLAAYSPTFGGNLTVSGGTITSGTGTLTLNSSANTVVLQSAGTTALTLDASQNATFAGTVTASKGGTAFYSIESTVNGAISEVIVKGKNSTGTAREARLGLNKYADDVFSIYDGTTERFRLGLTNGNATVTGALAINNTVQAAAAVASTHKVTISIGGVTYYLLATNV